MCVYVPFLHKGKKSYSLPYRHSKGTEVFGSGTIIGVNCEIGHAKLLNSNKNHLK